VVVEFSFVFRRRGIVLIRAREAWSAECGTRTRGWLPPPKNKRTRGIGRGYKQATHKRVERRRVKTVGGSRGGRSTPMNRCVNERGIRACRLARPSGLGGRGRERMGTSCGNRTNGTNGTNRKCGLVVREWFAAEEMDRMDLTDAVVVGRMRARQFLCRPVAAE
jgi:hypothetical protein